MSPTRAVDWSSMPSGPLGEISGRLVFAQDYAVFRSVCKSWWKASPARVIPWLIGHRKGSAGVRSLLTFHRLVSSYDGGLNLSPVLLDHPLVTEKRCRGLSYGWTALLYATGPISIVLRNPFTTSEINLPPLPIEYGQIYGAIVAAAGRDYVPSWELCILSADPVKSPTDYACLVSSCYYTGIAVWRVGDEEWTNLHGDGDYSGAVFYQNRFYVSSFIGDLYVCRRSKLKKIASVNWQSSVEPEWVVSHLVKSNDDLLLVMIHSTTTAYNFSVYKVSLNAQEAKLVALKDLGDRALFLGKNNSFSIEANKIPGCQRNKIYCIGVELDRYLKTDMKIKIYDMKDKTVSFIPYDAVDPHPNWTPYDWFMPNLLQCSVGATD